MENTMSDPYGLMKVDSSGNRLDLSSKKIAELTAVLDKSQPVPNCAGTLAREFTPEQMREFKAAWAESMRNAAPVPMEAVPDDLVQKQVEMLVANLPADSTGLLIVKLRGDYVTNETMACVGRTMQHVIDAVGLPLSVLIIPESGNQSVDFQLLTNDQLRDIGFERVAPRPNFLNITRDVV
jgi:hypothetical protein